MTANKFWYVQSGILEKDKVITNDRGFEMKLKDIFTQDTGIRWGEYQNPEITAIDHPKTEGVVSHFQLRGHESDLPEKHFVVYKESGQSHELMLSSTNGSKRTFFELIVSPAFFSHFCDDSSLFLHRFRQHNQRDVIDLEFTAKITSPMFRVIAEMRNTPYTGNLNRLFIESKATELLLLQIAQFDKKPSGIDNLTSSDTERLIYLKEYLDQHFADSHSICALSRQAGVSQTKMKSGFRQLFQSTVFAYITELRLIESKRLLCEEKLYVSEVADRVGYKYAHHFAAAFKKRFGISPTCMRSL